MVRLLNCERLLLGLSPERSVNANLVLPAFFGSRLLIVIFACLIPTGQSQVIDGILREGKSYGKFIVGVTGLEARFVPDGTDHYMAVSSTIADTPADGVFQVDDVVVSINGVAVEGSLPRIILGKALTAAEGSDGVLDFAIERGGSPMDVQISIPVLGGYSATWPLSCPKSDTIVQEAADYYAEGGIYGPRSVDAAFQALFLLSTGDDEYLDELGALRVEGECLTGCINRMSGF